ncbi:MAG TPA: hypothetical protein VNW06_10340 [Cytophagaceae bacterium]|jgi:hypothetical protein|nr:hypothetical protein [Cytophagaceae bacterium]
MKRLYSVLAFVSIATAGFIVMLYYNLSKGDFVEKKKPPVVIEASKHRDNMLLSAEYKNGTDFCKIDLLDSVNIEIGVSDSSGHVALLQTYRMAGDTIFVLGKISNVGKYITSGDYIVSNKLLIKGTKMLGLVKEGGGLDSIRTLDIKFNKLKK